MPSATKRRKEPSAETRQTPFQSLLPYWTGGQLKMPLIVRWGKHVRDLAHGGARKQNNLQHTYAMEELGGIFLTRLRQLPDRKKYPVDELLLMRGIHVHDRGEAEIKEDTLYINKSGAQDDKEIQGYYQAIESLPIADRSKLMEAFMLQFAFKDPETFSIGAASELIREMRQTQAYTSMAFEAIERWDYMLYGEEQYRDRGNLKVLVHIARHQFEPMDRLAEKFPPVKALIWTPEVRSWYAKIISDNKGRFIEHKSPKKKKYS